MTNQHWSDILGNDVSTHELFAMYHSEDTVETMAQWMERQSKELWGDEHDPTVDWQDLERQVWRELRSNVDTITLTTAHSASSYGVPVLVIDGAAYGPQDVTPDGQLAAHLVRQWATAFALE